MSKKGRKRRSRLPGAREPNGRLSRKTVHVTEREEMTMREAQSVMVAARMRHTGLPEVVVTLNDAGRPLASNTHGVMYYRGEITHDQWSAAEWWIGTRLAWLRSIKAPDAPTGNVPATDADDAAYEQWCTSIAATWGALLDCIRDASVEVRTPLASALDVFLTRDHYMPHMVGDLRLALNAIHRRFLAAARKAA